MDEQYAALDIRYHQGMLEGMKSRDPEKVCEWLKADITEAAKKIFNLFDNARKP